MSAKFMERQSGYSPDPLSDLIHNWTALSYTWRQSYRVALRWWTIAG
ncbi:hypothetical protein OROHE_007300 [Orobanche hederae]